MTPTSETLDLPPMGENSVQDFRVFTYVHDEFFVINILSVLEGQKLY
jgi:hypothetical protein